MPFGLAWFGQGVQRKNNNEGVIRSPMPFGLVWFGQNGLEIGNVDGARKVSNAFRLGLVWSEFQKRRNSLASPKRLQCLSAWSGLVS